MRNLYVEKKVLNVCNCTVGATYITLSTKIIYNPNIHRKGERHAKTLQDTLDWRQKQDFSVHCLLIEGLVVKQLRPLASKWVQ